MSNNRHIKTILNAFAIIFVLVVMLVAFFYRGIIEEYALSGYIGVFAACAISTASILLPAPSIFVVIQYSQFLNPIIVLLAGSLGTSIGELLGYILGRSGNNLLHIKKNNRLFKWFEKKPSILVFTFALIPAPVFDIVGIMAGAVKMHPIKFWCSCFLGKLLKFGFYLIIVDYFQDLINLL